MSRMIEIISENFHRIETVCKLGDNYHKCVFLYKNDISPEPREDIGTFTGMKFGFLTLDDSKLEGILLYTDIAELESDINPLHISVFEETMKKIKEITPKLDPFNVSDKHRKEIVCNFSGIYYRCSFFYKDDSKPVEPRKPDVDFDRQCNGILDGKISGTCLFNAKDMLKDLTGVEVSIFHIEENKKPVRKMYSDEQISSILSICSVDYPQFPLPKFKNKLTVPLINACSSDDILSSLSGMVVSDHLKPYLAFLNDISTNVKIDFSNLAEFFNVWRDYAFEKMEAFMVVSGSIEKRSLSGSPYLTIRTLKTHQSSKFDWEVATSNHAITNRDILNNFNSLPWDEDALIDRRIPLSILATKGIFPEQRGHSLSDFPLEMIYSEIELAMTPEDPPSFQEVELEEISDEIINDAMTQLMTSYPEHFSNMDDSFLPKVRESIINLARNEKYFEISLFEFPCDNDIKIPDEDNDDICKPAPSTEDDPFGVRNAIDNINKSPLTRHGSNGRLYKSLIGIPSYLEVYVKNRTEYETYLAACTSKKNGIEKCVFFELGDVAKYPKAFYDSHNPDFTNVFANSGKLTVEFVVDGVLKWDLDNLVKNLPFEYVLENVLFYPDRIKHKYVKDNYFLETASIEDIHLDLIEQDKNAMGYFCHRPDFNWDCMLQYPSIKWNSLRSHSKPKILGGHSYNLRSKESSAMEKNQATTFADLLEGEECNPNLILRTMVWTDLRTIKGLKILLLVLDDDNNRIPVDYDWWSPTRQDGFIVVKLKGPTYDSSQFDLVSHMVTPEVISQSSYRKWELSTHLPFSEIYQLYVSHFETAEKKPRLSSIYMIFTFSLEFLNAEYGKILLILRAYQEHLYNKTENKTKAYEDFIESANSMIRILNIFSGSSLFSSSKYDIESLGEKFTVEDVANSKYSYVEKMLEKL